MTDFDILKYDTERYLNSSKTCQDCGKHISLKEYLNAAEYMNNGEILCDCCYEKYVEKCLLEHAAFSYCDIEF